MKLAVIAIMAVALQAQDKAPVIPADHLEAFERARANEMETKATHDADVAKVKAAYDVLVADCKGEIPVQPDRDKPATCPAPKPAPESKK